MFKVGQKYRILKPFYTGAREDVEIADLVGTCVEIVGVDDKEAWFSEYPDGQKDWIFDSDVRTGCLELVEEEDVLEQRMKEYGFTSELDNGIGYLVRNDKFSIAINDSGVVNVKVKPSGRYISFDKSELEQLVVALTMLLEDK